MDVNKEEQELCQQLRVRIADLNITDEFRLRDFNIIRFLRARGMDLDKAEDMFRKYVKWREENDIDNARNWDVAKDLKENFVYHITGLSVEGGLVICVNVGGWNPAMTNGRYEELMKMAYHELENLTHMAKYFMMKANRFFKMVAVINLEGLTFAHCSSVEWIRALITLLKAFEANYPESLKVAFLINAPWVFSILWSIAKPFISTATHQRLRFLGADRKSWKTEILKYVAEDQFPETFGGSLRDNYGMVLKDDEVIRMKIMGNDTTISCTNDSNHSNGRQVDSIELD